MNRNELKHEIIQSYKKQALTLRSKLDVKSNASVLKAYNLTCSIHEIFEKSPNMAPFSLTTAEAITAWDRVNTNLTMAVAPGDIRSLKLVTTLLFDDFLTQQSFVGPEVTGEVRRFDLVATDRTYEYLAKISEGVLGLDDYLEVDLLRKEYNQNNQYRQLTMAACAISHDRIPSFTQPEPDDEEIKKIKWLYKNFNADLKKTWIFVDLAETPSESLADAVMDSLNLVENKNNSDIDSD